MAKSTRAAEPEDLGTNTSVNPTFGDLVAARLSRRQFTIGGLGTFAATMLACGDDAPSMADAGGPDAGSPDAGSPDPGVPDAGVMDASPADAAPPVDVLAFDSVGGDPLIAGDALWIPAGYVWKALLKCGDPIGSVLGAPPFRSGPGARATNTGVEAELQFGDNHDGLELFGLPFGAPATDRGLLVTNHESARAAVISGFRFVRSDDPTVDSQHDPDTVRKQKASHGVSVAEVYRDSAGEWHVQMGSPYAFKVHADTEIDITGPARGHAAMRTSADPHGARVRGTLGNCGSGATPWGTYLTCEEDSHKNYFYTRDWAADDPRKTQPRWRRYGITGGSERDYTWHFLDPRFHVDREPNEPNRFGWVVEIDPYDPSRRPAKRTALGRFAHENCAFLVGADRRVAVFMGDDQGFDYIYKFVTEPMVEPAHDRANRDLLDRGTLHVATFHADGTGTWTPLVHGQHGLTADNGFGDQGDVVIWARLAADQVGATQMDRPEWIDTDPSTGWVYATLSNNTARGQTAALADGRSPEPVSPANPRPGNQHGHIIRLRDRGGDVAAASFDWEMVVLAGTAASPNPDAQGTIAGDAFSSPDGAMFDAYGRLWISTDAADRLTFANQSGTGTDWAGLGNDTMLAMDTRTGRVKRFLVAPDGAEVCGMAMSADGRALFVNIQHPGSEQPRWNPDGAVAPQTATMTWPDMVPVADGGIQRSCTVVISRQDGGLIGIG
jgi:secreted PhoX family phosphatase